MTTTHEAVKTRHKETSLIFPVLALAVLLLGKQSVAASDNRNEHSCPGGYSCQRI
jgi:hypothetical protein